MLSKRRRRVVMSLVAGSLMLLMMADGTSRGEGWVLGGRGVDVDLAETPIVVPAAAAMPVGTYTIQGDPDLRSISAVVFEDGNRRWLAAVLPAIPAHRALAYRVALQPESGPSGVRFRESGANLEVVVDDRPLTTYVPLSNSKPIFFPVLGPTGSMVTRSYPMVDVPGEDRDHPHPRSCLFTHGDVNGIDFWAEDKPGTPPEKRSKGIIRETGRRIVMEGPVLGRLETKNDWLAPGGRRIGRDRRTVTFYRTRAVRILDFEVDVEATDGPITFGETKEGTFGFRLASSMDVNRKQGGKITNAEGLTDAKAWGKSSPWVDYVGPVEGRTVGLAILNHPQSFRFPTTWHVRDYGLFAANPFGGKDFKRPEWGAHTIPAGGTLRFAYRVILHEGDTAASRVAAHFEGYAHPPALRLTEDQAAGGR